MIEKKQVLKDFGFLSKVLRAVVWGRRTALSVWLAVCMSASTAEAATYYVAKNGDNRRTCADSQDPAKPRLSITGRSGGLSCMKSPGDTLMIRGGVYNERIANVTPDLKLPSGTSWNAAFKITSFPGEAVVIRGINFTTDHDLALCLHHTRSQFAYWIIDGLRIEGQAGSDYLISYHCSDHLRFSNLEIDGKKLARMGVGGGGRFNEFINVDIHDIGIPTAPPRPASYAMYSTTDDLLIDGMRVWNIHSYGLHLYAHECDEAKLKNCPDRQVIRNSTFWNTGIVNPSSAAILLSGGRGHRAINNVIYGNRTGIVVGFGVRDVAIFNNTIVSNVTGINVGRSTNTFVANNIVVNSGSYGINFSGLATGARLWNNLAYGNRSGAIQDKGSGTGIKALIERDPMFVGAARNDYHLFGHSPAINAGLDLSTEGVISDHDGRSRPSNRTYDLGAYEFGSITPRPPTELSVR